MPQSHHNLDVAISMVDLFCRLVSGTLTSVKYGRLVLWDMGQLYQVTTILTWFSILEVNSHSQNPAVCAVATYVWP